MLLTVLLISNPDYHLSLPSFDMVLIPLDQYNDVAESDFTFQATNFFFAKFLIVLSSNIAHLRHLMNEIV